jgi:hypothetical protein
MPNNVFKLGRTARTLTVPVTPKTAIAMAASFLFSFQLGRFVVVHFQKPFPEENFLFPALIVLDGINRGNILIEHVIMVHAMPGMPLWRDSERRGCGLITSLLRVCGAYLVR